MTHPLVFRAVIFDMDGLLLDSERIARAAWFQAAAAYGLSIPPDLYMQVIGRTISDTERLFKSVLGADFPFQAVRQLRLQYGDDYMQRHGMPCKPGAIELLDLLQAHGIVQAVATSTDSRALTASSCSRANPPRKVRVRPSAIQDSASAWAVSISLSCGTTC